MKQTVLIIILALISSIKCEMEQLKEVACWKRSYGRGIGSFQCGKNDEKDGWLCYPKCAENFNGMGPVCWETVCPKDKPINCGLSCTKTTEACGRLISLHLLTPVLSFTVPIRPCNGTKIP